MSEFLLDTNVVSETLRPVPTPALVRRLESKSRDAQFISVITFGELRRGTTLLQQGARRTRLEYYIEVVAPSWFGPRILAVSQRVAERWGALDTTRQLAGRPLSLPDGLLAATAIEHRLTLVTRNVKDFSGLGLTILNPWES